VVSESVAAMMVAHVARNVVMTLICDVAFCKAALDRASLSRHVTDSQMVRVPAYVTEATEMPDAHTAESPDVAYSGMTTQAAEAADMATEAADVTATEAANVTAAEAANVTAATKATMAATPTPARHG
jgi:hypothetical protein